MELALIIVIICAAILVAFVARSWKTGKQHRDLEKHSISPEELCELKRSGQEVLLYDVRQPLDLLANAEIIPGAKRIPPKELLQNPSLIPKERDSILYCT